MPPQYSFECRGLTAKKIPKLFLQQPKEASCGCDTRDCSQTGTYKIGRLDLCDPECGAQSDRRHSVVVSYTVLEWNLAEIEWPLTVTDSSCSSVNVMFHRQPLSQFNLNMYIHEWEILGLSADKWWLRCGTIEREQGIEYILAQTGCRLKLPDGESKWWAERERHIVVTTVHTLSGPQYRRLPWSETLNPSAFC